SLDAIAGWRSSTRSTVERNRSSCSSRSVPSCSVSAGSQISDAALVRIPVLLEIANQRGAEVAVGLLARERGHVLAEDVERLLPDADPAAVGGGRDEPGRGQRLHARFDGRVHVGRVHHLVDHHVALGGPRLELAAGEDRLPSQPVAHEPRQPQGRRARDDPLLARRQEQPRAALGDHVVDHVQELAGAADRVGLDRGHPQLLQRVLGLAGPELLRREPSVDLVHVAEVAGDEEEEREPPVVEEREVQPRAEDAPARVALVLDDAAADDHHLDVRIEQGEVGRPLGRAERVVILGVQPPRVADLEVPGLAAPFEAGDAEVGDAARAKVVEALERLGHRPEHRVHEVRPRPLRRQQVGDHQPLRDLEPVLLRQLARPLGLHLLARRHESRPARGGVIDEVLHTHRAREPIRQRRVELLGVCAEEALAGGIRRRGNRGGSGGLCVVARRPLRQSPQQSLPARQVLADRPHRRRERAELRPLGRPPRRDLLRGQTYGVEDLGHQSLWADTQATEPASTGSATPVTNEASSEHSHTTAAATSAGSPARVIACGAKISAARSGGSSVISGVMIAPGQTAFTRIPSFAYSTAAFFVRPRIPCLLAVYALSPATAISPALDDVFTIAPPPPDSICAIWCFIPRNVPRRFTAITRSKSSSLVSWKRSCTPMPALLWAKSSLPCRSTTWATRARLSSDCDTSQGKNPAVPPASTISLTVSSPASRELSRSETTTDAPSAPKRTAHARPMPLAAPVTRPALPSSIPITADGGEPRWASCRTRA